MVRILAATSIILLVSACGETDGGHAHTDHSGSDHTTLDMDMPEGDAIIAGGSGTVLSIGEAGDFLTLDHGPIPEIGMSAMRMGFDVANGVDLSGYQAGDALDFRVEATDTDILITQICRPATDGADCLR